MSMKNNDTIRSREELRAALQLAVKNNDTGGFSDAFDGMLQRIELDLRQEYEDRMEQLRQECDASVLAQRGVRQLTREERTYYQKLGEAMNSRNPKQALENLDVVLPKTVINSVFEDLRTNHPLLSLIDFIPSEGAIELMMNTNGYQEAAWGELCDEIVKELTSGFKAVNTNLLKLSAFLPVCKAMLELGPEWLDRYVREILYEAQANGLEAGIIAGDGKEKPIGMIRDIGEGVAVVDGVYPEKEAVAIDQFTPAKFGAMVGQLATSESGTARPVNNLVMIVNPVDYWTKVMPATTLQAPDGTYRNNVLPYPATIIQSPAVPVGKAVLGMAKRYFAAVGTAKDGRIEFSDHAKFLEDKRVYIIKAYANGRPKDNNSFVVLDISGLTAAVWQVQTVTAEA